MNFTKKFQFSKIPKIPRSLFFKPQPARVSFIEFVVDSHKIVSNKIVNVIVVIVYKLQLLQMWSFVT